MTQQTLNARNDIIVVQDEQRRFDLSVAIAAIASPAALLAIAFSFTADALDRAQFVVAGCEGVALALGAAVIGRALARRRTGARTLQAGCAA